MSMPDFYRRVYREDGMARLNWSSILQRVPLDRKVFHESVENGRKLEIEYLLAIVRPGCNYGVNHDVEEMGDDGVEHVRNNRTLFHVVSHNGGGRSNRKFMHTVRSADDPQHLPYTLEVQFMEPRDPEEVARDARDNGPRRLFVVSDAEWLVPERITSFANWHRNLWEYAGELPDVSEAGVVVWFDCERAKPSSALAYDKMPTLCLIDSLEQAGWIPVRGYICHRRAPLDDATLPYDSREALKQRWYYLVLLHIGRCLPLSDAGIPSVHPIAFYKLLLEGCHVKVGLSAKEYALQWNRGKLRSDDEVLPIEGDGPPEPLDDAEDFWAPLHGPTQALPKKKAVGGLSQPRRGRGRGRGRGGAAEPPAPVSDGDGSGGEGDPGGDGGEGDPGGHGGGGDGSGGDGGASGDGIAGGAVVPAEDFIALRPDWKVGDLVDCLEGLTIRFTPYTTKAGKYDPNWSMPCKRCPRGAQCMKRRGATAQHERTHGEIEPIAYLVVWHGMEWPTNPKIKNHRGETPKQADVDKCVRENYHQLVEICKHACR
jgi:hypothetical protein